MKKLLMLLAGLKLIRASQSPGEPSKPSESQSPGRPSAATFMRGMGAGMGIGALSMYVFDPNWGHRRRALARDQVIRARNKTNYAANVTASDVRNRTKGVLAEMRGLFRGDGMAPDEVVIARIRSRMGRRITHPRSIEVTCLDGHVTLSGSILASEVNALLRCAQSVRGVKSVENRLDVHEVQDDVPGLQGKGYGLAGRRTSELWSPTTRLAAGLAGTALVTYGAARRGPLGIGLGAFGAGLVTRSMTNLDAKRLTGIQGGRSAVRINKAINIHAPIEDIFGYWANFDNFPMFMRNVKEVTDRGNGHSHWKVKGPASTVVEWDAEITDWRENEVVAWQSLPGASVENTGTVRFLPNPDGSTRVDIHLSYNPPAGAIGHAIASLVGSDPKREMDEDLARMKTMIETGQAPHDAADPVLHDIQESH
ncbi:MAG TPA: SRPBCC family protein [Rhodothermales bacterium]|nr:SRPBCC family protein [Rhodothermales bacterium]